MPAKKQKGPKLYFSQFGGEQPIPPEFIAAMERREETQPVPNDVGPEDLSDTIVESKVETNRTNERVRRTVKKIGGNIQLQDYNTNQEGQPVQVTRTLYPTGTQPLFPSGTTKVGVKDLGNGWSIQEAAVEGTWTGDDPPVFTPGIFTDADYVDQKPQVPPEYVTDTATTAIDALGTAVAPTAPTGGRAEQKQVDEFIKRTTTETPTLLTTLTEKETDDKKVLATVVRTRGGSVGTPSATVDAELRTLPGGVAESITKTKAELFDEHEFVAEKTDPVPERFKASVQTNTEVVEDAATSVTLPTLIATEYRKLVKRISKFVRRTETTSRDDGSFPTLNGQEYDRHLDVIIPYTEDVLASGTADGDPHTEITPLSEDLQLVKSYDNAALLAVLDAYMETFVGTANISLPPVLIEVLRTDEVSGADGYSEDLAGSAFWTGHGSWTLSPRTTSEGSASVIPTLRYAIKQKDASHLPVTHYLFFLPTPVTIADVLGKLPGGVGPWPNFNPESQPVIIAGQRVRLQASATATAHDGGSDDSTEGALSNGTGTSINIENVITIMQLPLTIHDAIDLDDSPNTQDTNAQAVADAYLVSADSGVLTETATGRLITSAIGATDGDVAYPTSGVSLLDVDSELYGYGRAIVRATTLDWADA